MSENNRTGRERGGIKRRDFFKTSGVLLAGGAVSGRAQTPEGSALPESSGILPLFPVKPSQEGRIQSFRTLGRTGFRVSDISLGGSFLREPNVIRYAVDKGINCIDTAENYENGGADRAIRGALQHIDREAVFIATNAGVRAREDKDSVLARARRTLERLNTEYIDAYMMGSVSTVEWLRAPGYHAAMDQLKAEGRVRFTGVTYHGAEATDQTGMGDVLCAAAEDGRFDVLLFVYNFLNHSEGDRILAAAKANNVGTTAMKTAPGKLRAEPFDPDNLSEVFQQYLASMMRAGASRASALRELRTYSDAQNEFVARTQVFAERYGIENEKALQFASIQWVLQNPDMHTACISAGTFDFIDEIVALSGANSGNSRNGKNFKRVKAEFGEVEISVPRDRGGSFEPQLVKKHQRRLPGFDAKVIALYARGMTTREIQGHLEELYGVEVSPSLISAVTDSVLEDVKAWQSRPLDAVYPIVYLDAIHLKLHASGHVQSHAVYLALAINLDGQKELLGLWVGEAEGAKFWLSVLTELRNRGVQDILIACVDGLKGFPEAIESVYPKTQVQLCIVHMVRNSLRYVGWKERKMVARDLRTIYSAATLEAGEQALESFCEKWDERFPVIGKLWHRHWQNLSPFFAYPEAIRKVIYTTNAVESINAQLRKVTKKKGAFPNADSVRKVLYLALERASKRWTRPVEDWRAALNHLSIIFEGRVPV